MTGNTRDQEKKPKLKKNSDRFLCVGEIKDWGSGVRNKGPEKQC